MHGLMQEIPLMISSLIRYAAEYHGDRQVVSRTVEGPIHRYGYAECERRARRLANVMARLGIGHGDRVGTLAWNGYRHLELFYGVSGMGAVLHTVNPRALHRADRLHHQPRRRPGAVRRPHLRRAGGADRRSADHGRACDRDDRRRADAGERAAQRPLLRDPAGGRERGLCVASLRRARRVLALPTPRARRAIPRACSTATARPCCTPWPPARTAPWASRRMT